MTFNAEMLLERLEARREYAEWEESIADQPDIWVPFEDWLNGRTIQATQNAQAVWSEDPKDIA